MFSTRTIGVFSVFFFLFFIFSFPLHSYAATCDVGTANETPSQLEARLAQCQVEIAQQSNLVNQKSKEATTLSRDIAILKAKIKKSKLEIKARDLNIKKLDGGIQDKQQEIVSLNDKIGRMQASAGKLIRESHDLESASVIQVLLSDQTLSSFFVDLDNYQTINSALRDLFEQIKVARAQSEDAKTQLEGKKAQETTLKAVQVRAEHTTEALTNQKNQILQLTKGQESLYKQMLAQKQRVAAEIRNRLIRLTGGGQLRFGQALDIARTAENHVLSSEHVLVPPAFLLSILTQETGVNGVIGGNLGKCFYNTPWATPNGAVMSSREKPSFLQIMQSLSKDANTTPVSCPISRDGAYGGAMGPAQFMPSTWLIYVPRVETALGVNSTSPFDNLSAFTASAIYLGDGLIDCRSVYSTTYDQERCAAAKYYAGLAWRRHMKDYGRRVADRAQQFQKDIDVLDAQTSASN